ncbi:MAG: PKD domain-containing protein [Paludibacter sp.]|nr:PKD domain-containing protein [Paludibacter sp.]
MRKVFKFSVFVAIAFIAFACEKAVIPTASFTYEAEDLTVTFTNTSKDATSYVWDFGDETTSTEANPVHTYAEAGDYTVTLTAKNGDESKTVTEEISLTKPLIQLDGVFSDWNEVPANKLASTTLPNGASLTALKEMKVCADENFIFFYIKMDQAHVAPLDIFMNTDNNATTGGNSWLWDPCGADYLIEGFVDQAMGDATVFNWPATSPQDGWAWVEAVPAGSGIVSMSEIKTVSGTIVELEGSIVREMIPTTLANEIGFGIFSSNADWAETGSLPTAAADAETKAPLLTVKLN